MTELFVAGVTVVLVAIATSVLRHNADTAVVDMDEVADVMQRAVLFSVIAQQQGIRAEQLAKDFRQIKHDNHLAAAIRSSLSKRG